MKDYFLRANTESELLESLESIGITEESVPFPYALHIIGTIYKPTGETDEEGMPIMQPIDGYHANLRTLKPLTQEQEDMLPIIDKPNQPHGVFA